ncbi:hypothetical protein O6H91_19G008700 [Diphasiastrum complanatum]|uniref:Uncharacterized protein n=1 Tax=Diphasiastrum complanatum TaxID=34168 RepID=A0ACC2ASI8_DIPCM|nr:hypothetical protein O6H91_Y410500 [Diphasiastrum complanatum]KAJ7520513.1 hypothetical protein O6H91_19G008700 [Diphasiastrum complanatum]
MSNEMDVHEIHDIVWKGVPRASWLRDQHIQFTWQRILFVPVGGGMIVGLVNALRMSCEDSTKEKREEKETTSIWFQVRKGLSPFLKAFAAAITLGTGNSLGPEGPSVEIGASIAQGIGTIFKSSPERKSSLVAAGSAAGISSGFNAAVAGCFFAIESVLRPSSSDSASSLTTTMLLLSSVLASVISQAGLGSDPAFKLPAYDFRSPAELPLYLLLGIICGGVSVVFTKGCTYATYAFDSLQQVTSMPAAFLPSIGGLCVGLVALAYPEVLYWGFENVDVLLESRPWVRGPPVNLLLQLVGAKLLATSICRGSRLVGGIYAPSIFMGAALGSAYGKLVGFAVTHADPLYHLDALKVAAPQAYALVGMAAMLAGVCQVPLTSVLLLFELTRDYRIILPLMAAVGLSSWIASSSSPAKKKGEGGNVSQIANQQSKFMEGTDQSRLTFSRSTTNLNLSRMKFDQSKGPVESSSLVRSSKEMDICAIDSSLCLTYASPEEDEIMERLPVSAAMRTTFSVVPSTTAVVDVMQLMVARMEWCVLLVDSNHILQGLVTLGDIEKSAENLVTIAQQLELGGEAVSTICGCFTIEDEALKVVTAYPDMNLKTAQQLMNTGGFRQLPVINDNILRRDRRVLGVIDRESIMLACRFEATRKLLGPPLPVVKQQNSNDGAILHE